MNWMKKNPYLTLLFSICFLSSVIFLINQQEDTSYKEIHIQEGDTLWSLSYKYSGSMSQKEWIDLVMKENHLYTETIFAGNTLTIPNSLDRFAPDHGVELASENR